MTGAEPELVLALHAETLDVSKRIIERTVQVRLETRRRDAVVDETLRNASVVIEHVPAGRFVDAVPPVREENGVTILPVVEEVLVVERRLRLKEEVHIRRVHTSMPHTETVVLREQHVVVTRSEPRSLSDGAPGATVSTASSRPSEPMSGRVTNMPNETIVAVYDTAGHAEQAVQALVAAKVPEHDIHRHAGEGSYAGSTTTATRRTEEPGFWSTLFGGHAGDDQTVYENSLQSGGNVVTVMNVPQHDVAAVTDVLERFSPIDIDERAAGYAVTGRSSHAGMTTGTAAAGINTAAEYSGTATGMATGSNAGSLTGTGTAAGMRTADQGGTMQLAEESLSVGKRLINQGGTRIRRYVVETPVEEKVTLRSEKVTLDRRPVNDGRPVTDGSFTEKTVEMTESTEEPIVSKTARVVEEVALRKDTTERVETVRDTVRKEQVDVEQLPGDGLRGTAASGNPAIPRT